MRVRNNRISKFRNFWPIARKTSRRTEKWPAWKKNIQVARHITLLK